MITTDKARRELGYWENHILRDGNSHNGHYVRAFTDHFHLTAGFFKGKRILDIGCGPLGSLEWAADAAQRIGIDPLSVSYRELGTRNHGMYYAGACAEGLPFKDASFDVVSSFNSLDQFDDLEKTAREIVRVMADGALFLLIAYIPHGHPVSPDLISYSWDLARKFSPPLALIKEQRFEKSPLGIYRSLALEIPYRSDDPAERHGVLSAKFMKAAKTSRRRPEKKSFPARAGIQNDFPEDLTILTLFSGKSRLFPGYAEALAGLRKPPATQLLFINNSGRAEFGRLLRSIDAEVFEFPHFSTGADPKDRLSIARQCELLYEFSKTYVRGRQILIWEDDVIPRADALEKLREEARKTRADLVAGTLVSRNKGGYLAWRAQSGDPRRDVRRVEVLRGTKRVFASGFGLLLLGADLFRAMPFRAEIPGFPFFGCDLNAGVWAFEKDLRWFVAGGVRCAHLAPDGTPAHRGHLQLLETERV